MVHKIAQIQEIDCLHIDPLVLKHQQHHNDYQKNLVPDVIIVLKKSLKFKTRWIL